jgi:hypothetical protein
MMIAVGGLRNCPASLQLSVFTRPRQKENCQSGGGFANPLKGTKWGIKFCFKVMVINSRLHLTK